MDSSTKMGIGRRLLKMTYIIKEIPKKKGGKFYCVIGEFGPSRSIHGRFKKYGDAVNKIRSLEGK